MVKQCEYCGKEFEAQTVRRKFCSDACRQREHRKSHPQKGKTEEQKRRDRERQREKYAREHHIGEKRICVICGNEFMSKSEKGQTCSKQCARMLSRRKTGFCNSYLITKTCVVCGEAFKTYRGKQVTCSKECSDAKDRERRNHQNTSFRSRCKKYGVYFDAKVKADLVIKRDGCVCQICGKRCDPSDKRWGFFGPDYPTLDHIRPLSKGGTHTWDNVQCACGMCNSEKRDLLYG